MISCPKCNRVIVDGTSDGGYKVRARMVLFNQGVAQAICPSCKEKVNVPLVMNTSGLAPSKHTVITVKN